MKSSDRGKPPSGNDGSCAPDVIGKQKEGFISIYSEEKTHVDGSKEKKQGAFIPRDLFLAFLMGVAAGAYGCYWVMTR